jgi:hypothetical protein
MPAILYPFPKIVKNFNTIVFTGGTGVLGGACGFPRDTVTNMTTYPMETSVALRPRFVSCHSI